VFVNHDTGETISERPPSREWITGLPTFCRYRYCTLYSRRYVFVNHDTGETISERPPAENGSPAYPPAAGMILLKCCFRVPMPHNVVFASIVLLEFIIENVICGGCPGRILGANIKESLLYISADVHARVFTSAKC
jgi:hypothetical protein